MNGKVKFYDNTKGYGFIKTETRDYFFCHVGVLNSEPSPQKGEEVSFTVARGSRGVRAENIIKLKDTQLRRK